jgi:TonB family protein
MGTSASELSHIESRPIEQRLSLRKRVSLPTPIELLPGKEMWLLDLGEGGLSVTGSSRLDRGTTACARFKLPETDSVIDAAGVVAWSDDSGRTGVRFTRVEPDSTMALRRWLRNGALISAEHFVMNNPPDAELADRISCLSEIADLQSAISAAELDCEAALSLIVRRMMELTRATGGAIALRDGDDVVCRASSGNAPDVGVRLSPTSLSGECFQSGSIVMLEDSEVDPRVNPELCRQLNFRSLLVLPIMSGREIIGIAEVLSPEARKFAGGDTLVLSFMADLIATIALPRIQPDRNAVPEPFHPAIFDELRSPEETDVAPLHLNLSPPEDSPMLLSAADVSVIPEVEAAAVELPAVSQAPAQAISPVPFEVEEIPAATPAASNYVIPAVAVMPVATPARRLADPRSLPLEAAELEPRTSISRFLPLAVTCVVLLARASLLAGYYFSRSSTTAKPAANAPVSKLASTATTAAPASTASVPTEIASAAPPVAHPQTKPGTTKPELQAKTSTSITDLSARELQVTHGASQRPVAPIDNQVPEAPLLNPLASSNSGALPASLIPEKTAPPQLQAPPAIGVTEGKLLRKVLPQYPQMARSANISGDVVLSAKIGTDGVLHSIKVVSGNPLLREAAIDAARQWRYLPYKLGGKPVETDTRITITFHR